MNNELALYVDQLHRFFDRLEGCVRGLDEGALNWQPPVSEPNSIFVLATHIMGNAEGWILGIACGQHIPRDRDAEFVSLGSSAALLERAHELLPRIDAALAALPDGAMDEQRDPTQALWGVGTTHPVSVREAIMHVIEHAGLHLGHIDMVKELAKAEGAS
jgi:hypothetical protein